MTNDALRARMHLLTSDGRTLAGADAIVEIARHTHCGRSLVLATRLPGVLPLLRSSYDWLAAHRGCGDRRCRARRRLDLAAWLPLALLPICVFSLRSDVAPWCLMWATALAIYAGCKWLTFRKAVASGANFTTRQAIGYLIGWVGMEPQVFATGNDSPAPRKQVAARPAIARIAAGIALVWGGAPALINLDPIASGWAAMFGIVLILHFGLFDLLAFGWQQVGVPVKPLMCAPLQATSLGDFWGARWNTGFHTLAHHFVFRPLYRRIGHAFASFAVFLTSGLIHELVITVPAGGGYGLPTAYFILQGLGLVLERSAPGRKLALGSGRRGRIFALATAAVPAFWLFPPVFVRNVILPMLHALGAT